MLRSRITGTGSYVPPRVVTNNDLAQPLDTSDEWIRQRTGIEQRHWVEAGQCTSDLALQASLKALDAAKVPKEKLDLIVFATLSPDHEFPGTGCFLQAKLGVPNIAVIDVRQQCTGFVYALSIADAYLRMGMFRTALVIGAEIHSVGLDKTPRGRDISVLFGDGAGAVVLEATEVSDARTHPCIWSTKLHADGSGAEDLWLPAPGTNVGPERITPAMLEQLLHFPKMNGKKVFTHAVRRMSETLAESLAENSLAVGDVDLFLFHQANLRINEAVAQQLSLPWDKVFNTIHKYGNTTAATIPLGMDQAVQAGKLKPGMLVALAAFGSGYTWASGVLRF